MAEVRNLFDETRRLRKKYHLEGKKFQIDAAACAIRERALLDAMVALGMDKEEARRLAKF